ncbi:MAG: hypothetical protein HQM04_05120 [Magnetococcales bacterium]|nr:hypothetical protein [Magnetococcales bacterium]MBF0114405.1 hypothetical protein [Magnetococcales bacterium]
MEELPCLTQLLQKVSAQQIGSAHLDTTAWLQAHPEQIQTLHVVAHILLNVTQRALSGQNSVPDTQDNRPPALQRVAQAEKLWAWSERVQALQQHRAQQQAQVYGNALQQWLQQVVQHRHNQEVL